MACSRYKLRWWSPRTEICWALYTLWAVRTKISVRTQKKNVDVMYTNKTVCTAHKQNCVHTTKTVRTESTQLILCAQKKAGAQTGT